jgi:hypothetical protein
MTPEKRIMTLILVKFRTYKNSVDSNFICPYWLTNFAYLLLKRFSARLEFQKRYDNMEGMNKA